MEPGQYWPESHFPEVKIYKGKEIVITIHVAPWLCESFQKSRIGWTYTYGPSRFSSRVGIWQAYIFRFNIYKEFDLVEIKALNTLLSFCCLEGIEGQKIITDGRLAQLAFVNAENPVQEPGNGFQMGRHGLWGYFASSATQILLKSGGSDEYISAHMRGACKIMVPKMRASRKDNWMRLYANGNAVPIFQTFGNCACLSVTSNELDYGGGFTLAPHNVDGHTQQFLLMTGVLMLWERLRRQV